MTVLLKRDFRFETYSDIGCSTASRVTV